MSTQPEHPSIARNPDGGFSLRISRDLYAKEAVMAAAYRFTDSCAVNIGPADQDTIEVSFQVMADDAREAVEALAARFWNELLDQQLRLDLDKQYGHLRDLIAEHAFRPLDPKGAQEK